MIIYAVDLFLSFYAGCLLAATLAPELRRSPTLMICLGCGLGLGISSALYFVLLNLLPLAAGWVCSGLIAAAALLLLLYKRPLSNPLRWYGAVPGLTGQTNLLLKLTFAVSLFIAVAYFCFRCLIHPHSDWDAVMVWNLRARFLERGPLQLHEAFSRAFTNADYPLLLPSIVALGLGLSQENQLAPISVAFVFTFLAPFLLFAALARLKSRQAGMLGAAILLTTPFWVHCGAFMYADLPLSYYLLCMIVCCACFDEGKPGGQPGYLVLAGLFGTMAVWTKNEGMLACLSLLLSSALLAKSLLPSLKRVILPCLAGALPLCLVILWFKFAFAPTNDYVLGLKAAHSFAEIFDPSRLLMIGEYFFVFSVTFGKWLISPVPLILLVWFLSGPCLKNVANNRPFLRSFLSVGLILAGYALAYLISPNELRQHLITSIDRLYLQVWPAIIFALVGSGAMEEKVAGAVNSAAAGSLSNETQ